MPARTLVREGPAALWTTTTRASLDDEMETRLLSLTIRDDLEQTQRVMTATARQYHGRATAAPDLAPWHAVQNVLQRLAPCAVVIPFAGLLAEHTDATQVRARRDFSKLLALIAASAILHHRQRLRDDEGRLVADLVDNRYVHQLLAPTFQATAAGGCTPAVREAVQAVAALVTEHQKPATVRQVGDRLKIDRSAASRRLAVALRSGWLADDREGGHTKQLKLRIGDPLPEERAAIPDPTCWLGRRPDRRDRPGSTRSTATCPRCGRPLAEPWHNLGYGERAGAWCEHCSATVWQPEARTGATSALPPATSCRWRTCRRLCRRATARAAPPTAEARTPSARCSSNSGKRRRPKGGRASPSAAPAAAAPSTWP